jgi:ribosomal protein S18 acetylase RimI-like enzyme
MRKASGRVGIASIAVKSNSKRLGVGSALLDALELEALSRGHTVFCASTKSTNLPAINFYKKKGFEVNPSKGNNMSFVKRL